MSTRTTHRFAISLLAALASLPVLAQGQPASPGLPPAIAMPPGQPQQAAPPPAMPPAGMSQMHMGPTDNQIADEAAARIALLKASLRLTPEQEGRWAGLDTALREIMTQRIKARAGYDAEQRQMRDQMRQMRRERWQQQFGDGAPGQGQPQAAPMAEAQRPGEIARMRAGADRMAARAAELRRIADAAEPLYTQLDQRQRALLISFIERGFAGERR